APGLDSAWCTASSSSRADTSISIARKATARRSNFICQPPAEAPMCRSRRRCRPEAPAKPSGWMVGVMNYWLVKSEPSSWSWDQQVAKGAKGEAWTGVRNFTARQNLVKMKKGDRAFFYHSNEGKDIVGIAEVIKEAYPDPTDKTGKFVCVDIKADQPLKTPVTMAVIKADKRLADMALV